MAAWRRYLGTGKQSAQEGRRLGCAKPGLFPSLCLTLGLAGPIPLLTLVSCVLERQSPHGCGSTNEVVEEYLWGFGEVGASAWVMVRTVPSGKGSKDGPL